MPRIEPRWLTVDEVIRVNKRQVELTGEPFFVKERGLLESACARPRVIYEYEGEEDIVRLAIALTFGIGKNHPFQQGNKRTAFYAGLAFIHANGYLWTGDDDPGYWGPFVIELERGALQEARATELLRYYVQRAPAQIQHRPADRSVT